MPNISARDKARVAGGAGFVFLGRMGALIEAASFIAFSWFYGTATFGLFAVLWSYVKLTTALTQIAMNTALQRFIPKAKKEDESLIAGFALKISFMISATVAGLIALAAPVLADFVNASSSDSLHLVNVIRIYVWVLPFWCLVDVATAAVRATRTFGPEIKIRIFYEQGLRFVGASIFAAMGFLTYGLFAAHLISVLLSAALALRLVSRHYDLGAILKAPLTGPIAREMWHYGITVMPAYFIKMLFSEFPVIFLNMLIPGAGGAAMGGFYSVARKIASTLQAIHKTFEYVIAPLASEKIGNGDNSQLNDMLTYATRLSVSITVLFGAAIMLARHDILMTMRPEFQTAYAAIAILCLGRIIEAATGPSAAVVEMLGHRALPALNGIAGLAVLVGLGFYLIPDYKVTGAAIAAATGLNVTATLSVIENRLLFGLFPYNKYSLKPLVVSVMIASIMLSTLPFIKEWPTPVGILTAVFSLLAGLALLIRYGLHETDTAPFGKLGTLLRRSPL